MTKTNGGKEVICALIVVNMEHKPGVKGDKSVQHKVAEKTALSKKSESGIKSAARKIENSSPADKRSAGKVAENPTVAVQNSKLKKANAEQINKKANVNHLESINFADKITLPGLANRNSGKTSEDAVQSVEKSPLPQKFYVVSQNTKSASPKFRVVNTEHKLLVKGEKTIQHGIAEKTALFKMLDREIKSAARTIGVTAKNSKLQNVNVDRLKNFKLADRKDPVVDTAHKSSVKGDKTIQRGVSEKTAPPYRGGRGNKRKRKKKAKLAAKRNALANETEQAAKSSAGSVKKAGTVAKIVNENVASGTDNNAARLAEKSISAAKFHVVDTELKCTVKDNKSIQHAEIRTVGKVAEDPTAAAQNSKLRIVDAKSGKLKTVSAKQLYKKANGNRLENLKKAAGATNKYLIKPTAGVVKTVGTAADGVIEKVASNVDNEAVQVAKKSYDVLSGTVRVGGKTLKVSGKTVINTVKLGRFIGKKVKLQKAKKRKLNLEKSKPKQLNKAVNPNRLKKLKLADRTKFKVANGSKSAFDKQTLEKIKKAIKNGHRAKKVKKVAGVVNEYAVKPSVSLVKAADGVIEKATANINNDAVQFAKKSYDVAKTGVTATVKTAKVTGKTIKTAVKVTRTLATKTGRKRLVKSVKRRVRKVKRNIQRVKKGAKMTARAAKATAKATAKAAKVTAKVAAQIAKAAAQIVAKLVSLIAQTAPYSLIVIAVIAVVILMVYLVSNSITAIAGKSEQAAGWVAGESDTESEIYENFVEFADVLKQVCVENFGEPLKSEVTDFLANSGESEDAPRKIIILDTYTSFPAHDGMVKTNIDLYINGASSYSSTGHIAYASDFMAALAVLKIRENGGYEGENVLEKFTQADFEEFIGGVNENSCIYGDTFFIKTTMITSGETCPNEDCKTEYRDDDCCSRENEDGETEYYCGGHGYCDHDHEKLTITLESVDRYYGRTFAEIYGFDEEEQEQFETVSEFISTLLNEIENTENSE